MTMYRILADAVVAMHALYVGFVLLGIVAILVGAVLGWDWVRNFWFRTVHFLMIAVVVFEAWLGIKCPLTTWEDYFRAAAGETVSEGTFIGRCLHRLIFLDVPASSLTIFYVLFGALVLATLFLVRPRPPRTSPLARFLKPAKGLRKESANQ
ncbi:MAG: DUF2784 domain-containing protein [Thermoguttaceae bacterium]